MIVFFLIVENLNAVFDQANFEGNIDQIIVRNVIGQGFSFTSQFIKFLSVFQVYHYITF